MVLKRRSRTSMVSLDSTSRVTESAKVSICLECILTRKERVYELVLPVRVFTKILSAS